MTSEEFHEHLDFIDGVQKAQMIALRLLLRDREEVKLKLRDYAEHLARNPPTDDLSAVQLESMKAHLLGLAK